MFDPLKNAIKKLDIWEILAYNKYALTRQELLRLHDVTEGQQFGVLSAYRGSLSRNENKRRHSALARDLNALGVPWEATQGTWGIDTGDKRYEIEQSFFIYNIAFEDIKGLAHMYDQDAFIFKPDDGTVGLYDLTDNNARVAVEVDIETNVPRPRVKEEKGIEHVPSTRFRDVELTYDWSDPIPFGSSPIYL